MKEHKSKVPRRRFFRYGRTCPAGRKTASRAGVETPVLLVGLVHHAPCAGGACGSRLLQGQVGAVQGPADGEAQGRRGGDGDDAVEEGGGDLRRQGEQGHLRL